MRPPTAAHASTPREISDRLRATRGGRPFLVYRDGDGAQRIFVLEDAGASLTIGRGSGADIQLHWDAKVSRVHAELQPIGGEWALSDDGLSQNGTFVGEERVRGQRRLRDGDLIAVGDTVVAYCEPARAETLTTELASDRGALPELSEGDRQLLRALCRPLIDSPFAAPASNAEIAAGLHLSIPAVKRRLNTLFRRFGLADLPQNQKRASLAAEALRSGLVANREG